MQVKQFKNYLINFHEQILHQDWKRQRKSDVVEQLRNVPPKERPPAIPSPPRSLHQQ